MSKILNVKLNVNLSFIQHEPNDLQMTWMKISVYETLNTHILS